MIGLIVVPLIFFWNVESGFSTVGVGVILENECGIQGQNYVASLQWSKVTVGFHYSNWVVCIKCYRFPAMNNYNGAVVNELQFQFGDLNSFPERGEFNLLFNVDIVILLLKKNDGETKGLMSLFL